MFPGDDSKDRQHASVIKNRGNPAGRNYFCTKLVQFYRIMIFRLLQFRTKPVQSCPAIVIGHIKLIPFPHVVKVSCREPFYIRISVSKVKTKLVDNTGSPSRLRLFLHYITPQKPIKLQNSVIGLQGHTTTNLLVATLNFLQPIYVIFIGMEILRNNEIWFLIIFHTLILFYDGTFVCK